MLEARDLVKTFPGEKGAAPIRAVDGVSLAVGPGQVFTLLGPSGCGKTTTLRCIAGLDRPESGSISVAGRVLFSSVQGIDVPVNTRGLGMVFQSYAIWPHMTVWDHAAFPLTAAPRRRRPRRREIRLRAERALEAVRLDHLAGRRATDLSGGEQQRLALARALVLEPPLLLLDEPLSNLDANLRVEMRDELHAMQRQRGAAWLYVTHDQEEALAISDTVAVMRAGRIEQVGEPRAIYEQPGSRFVAAFIGRANLVEGVVQRPGENGTLVVHTPYGALIATGRDLQPGEPATVVVRPEDVRLAPPDGASINGWAGTVRGRAFLGDAVDYLVDLGGLELRVRTQASVSVSPGTTIALRFRDEPLPALRRDASAG